MKDTIKTPRFLEEAARRYRLTFQEFRQVRAMARDLEQWGEEPLDRLWRQAEQEIPHGDLPVRKKRILRRLGERHASLQGEAKRYGAPKSFAPKRPPLTFQTEVSDKKIFGRCPAFSEKTVCCNLHTIDAVENCGFGCSYCTIQTFYGKPVTFDARLGEKLKKIELDPGRFYHIGTGQSSDSLMWGNRGGMLDDLCAFAGDHPNVLLELKTKSARVDYFLERDVPPNVVLSWSLNTPAIIKNEEHFTASLEERLKAARKAADRGIPVAFHFHPMVYYEGWKEEYTGVAGKVLENFAPGEVRFISLGTVTFIKPVLQAIRRGGLPTKMLQMPFQKDPLGKWTYPDRLKEEMFKTLYQALAPWHGKVFIYLCMEKPEIWKKVFGFAYPSHREFENAFALLNPFGLTSPGECHRQGRL